MAEYAHEKRDNSRAKEESPKRLLTAQNIYIVFTQYLRKLYANLTHLCVNFCKIQNTISIKEKRMYHIRITYVAHEIFIREICANCTVAV